MNKTTVLVTGGSKGIGLELCNILAHNKFEVFLIARNRETGQKKVNELVKKGFDVHFLQLDVSDHETIPERVSTLINKFENIDILVNNAGIYIDSPDLDEFPSFLDFTTEILTKTFNTNIYGPMILTQNLLPYINNNGLIINVSSGMGKLNTSDDRSGHLAYRCSKASLNAFSRTLGNLERGIKVVSMCPGWVKSEMGGDLAPRSLQEGANDIYELIEQRKIIRNGSFYFNSIEQLF